MITPLKHFCNSLECKSQVKIIYGEDDIKRYHSNHIVQMKSFEQLMLELKRDDHPLRNLKILLDNDKINSFIDEEISKLSQSFQQVLIDLKCLFKNNVASHVQSLQSLTEIVDLYEAVIQRNHTKIEELQYAIPKLSINSNEIKQQEAMAQEIKSELEEVFKRINESIQGFPKVSLDKKTPLSRSTIQGNLSKALINPNLSKASINYQWSSTLKHSSIQVTERIAKSQIPNQALVLIEPSFTMNDITRVRLRIKELFFVEIKLCDVNIAQNYTDDCQELINESGLSYSHLSTGGHRLMCRLEDPYPFEQGDILELEWNGPMKQFTTSRPSTNHKYVQNVKFDLDTILHFGAQLAVSSVEII